MSIIIEGLSLPEKGMTKTITIYPDGDCAEPTAFWDETRLDDVKAKEFPPHGRLIDADALRAEHGLGVVCENCPVDKRHCQYEMIYTKMEVCGWLDDADTIIPADPEDTADLEDLRKERTT